MDVYKPTGRNLYRFDYKGKIHHTGCRDLAAARKVMNDTVRRAEREEAGLPVVAQEMRRAPVAELVAAWIADLARQNRTVIHQRHCRTYVVKTFAALHWSSISAFRLEPFATFLRSLGRSSRTQNAYRAALYQFFQFCCSRQWAEENPLKHFRAAPLKKTRLRRAYTPDELARLCQTPNGEVYMVAALSGFRFGELAQMQKQDLSPDAAQPEWHPRAEIQKSRRRDRVPILPELLTLIRRIWHSLPSPTSLLFPAMPSDRQLVADRQAADIVTPDALGRHADFHSLRYTFCTQLARVMPIHQVQRFMRHADVRMTSAVYMDLGLTDLWAAAQSIPSLNLSLPQPLPPALSLPQNLADSPANSRMSV